MTRTIAWDTSKGKASVVVELVTSRDINADGDKVMVACCDMHIVGNVDGIGVVGYDICTHDIHPKLAEMGVVAMCGKLGIKQDQYNEIIAAINEIKATPEWQAKIARQEAGDKAAREYDEHRATMRKAMSY